MEEANQAGGQSKALFYDFYQTDLWLNRFASLSDLTDSNFKLWPSVLQTVGGLTSERIAQLIHTEEQRRGVTLGHLQYELASLKGSLPAAQTDASGWAAVTDFEVRQLLNLYTLNYNLYNFEEVGLQTVVREILDQQSKNRASFYLMRECFRRVAMDAEIFQRAMIQRRWESDTAGNAIRSAQAEALRVTDRLAFLALAPLQHLLPGMAHLNPITYFSQHTHIRRVPYSDSAVLVGIRYDCIPLELNRRFSTVEEVYADHPPLPAFELMAIPHEVGHYIFHHARPGGAHTFAAMGAQLQNGSYTHWCEEIFADLYGCLVGGPLAVLGLQGLVAFGDEEALAEDDGEHPIPLVRPFVLTQILRTLQSLRPEQYNFSDAAEALDENWSRILQGFGYVLQKGDTGVRTIQPPGKPSIHVAQMLADTGLIVDVFAPILLGQIDAGLTPAGGSSGSGSNNSNELSLAIPWSQRNTRDLTAYNADMAALTTWEFAQKSVAHQILAQSEQSQHSDLQRFLEDWGDSGPVGHGDPT